MPLAYRKWIITYSYVCRHCPSSISGKLLMAQQYNLPHPISWVLGLGKPLAQTEQPQIKCLNQPRHCAHYNSLKVLGPGPLQTFWP